MQIPDSVFSLYEEFADDFIDSNFGQNCKLYYPPLIEPCVNCTPSTVANKYTSKFQHGGMGGPTLNTCDFCDGEGTKQTEQTEVIKLRVYASPRDWVKIAGLANIPDGSIQIIGKYSDLNKLRKADYIVINSDQEMITSWRYELSSEAVPHGFKGRRYFIAMMKRI